MRKLVRAGRCRALRGAIWVSPHLGGGGIYCAVDLLLSGSRLFSNISPSVYNNEEPLHYNDTVHIQYYITNSIILYTNYISKELLHYSVYIFWINKMQTQYSNKLLLPNPVYIIIHRPIIPVISST